jgi:hypothetical protein
MPNNTNKGLTPSKQSTRQFCSLKVPHGQSRHECGKIHSMKVVRYNTQFQVSGLEVNDVELAHFLEEKKTHAVQAVSGTSLIYK